MAKGNPSSRQAQIMRERRANPALRQQERDAQNAYKAATRIVCENHEDEFLAVLQQQREQRGLPPFIPRGKHARITIAERAETKPELRPEPEVQAKCTHTTAPLRKLPYGTFCGSCGARIR